MKKNHYLFFIIILMSLFIFPTGVKAYAKCEYVWKNTIFSTEKDSKGKDVPVKSKFVLETKGNSKKLTKATSPYSKMKATFANKDGISLKSNGDCPTISIYSQQVNGGFKIYKNSTTCKNGLLTIKSRCSGNLKGKKTASKDDENNTSASNDTGANSQFKLTSSTSSKCVYDNKSTSSATITIKKKSNKKASTECKSHTISSTCRVKDDNLTSVFYKDSKFTCPAYIYTKVENATGNNITTYIYKIVDQGTEVDEDRSGATTDEDKDAEYLDDFDLKDYNKTQSCTQIFGSPTDKESIAYLIQKLLNYIKIAGPILVILLSSIDFVKVIWTSDDENMKKAQQKLGKRLVAAVLLFLLPTLIGLMFNLINNSITDPTCGIK